jgi:predicted O-methyltransferase YrrM
MRFLVVSLIALVTVVTPLSADTALTPAIERLLKNIRAADKGQLAVSEEDGRFLRVLVASTGAKRVLEIGAASGYSAIWMGLGVRQTGGTVVTIEYDPVRAREAADNVQRAGLQDVVRVIAGDAFKEIPKLPGTFDLVFLDAWKPDYKKFFDMVFPRVNGGGLFLAHNVINKKNEMKDFLSAIQTHPQAVTTVVSPGFEGISMTYKTR